MEASIGIPFLHFLLFVHMTTFFVVKIYKIRQENFVLLTNYWCAT